jgi:hypothetical protein
MSPNCGGRGRVAGSQPMNTAVYRCPNKLWRSNSIFNLPYAIEKELIKEALVSITISLLIRLQNANS